MKVGVLWWRSLGAVVALLATAMGQDHRLAIVEQERDVVALRAMLCAGAPRAGGVGFLRLECENLDARPRRALAEFVSPRGSEADVRLSHTFDLPPGERGVVFLPVPRPMLQARLSLRVDGQEQADILPLGRAGVAVALLIADRPDATPAAIARLQAMGQVAPDVTVCRAADAPDDWRLYTGFDAVVVDGRARLAPGVQDALRRAANAGAMLVVAGPDALPAGPLRQLAVQADGAGPHGFGVVASTPALDRGGGPAQPTLTGLREFGQGPLPAADSLLLPRPIPGLGEAPVSVFLLVIVLFTVVAGPVNFLWLRRKRRPLLALVTVPALGFSTTFVILAYGLLNDGFGVRGTVDSWSWLDQERHEVAAVVSRTLFAGRAPGALVTSPQSLLLAPRALARAPGAGDRWHVDGAGAAVDGGALPSRTPTPLLTVQQGQARQRLVARRQGDDLVLANDGGVVPLGEVVLRDLEGNWYHGKAPKLQRVSAGAAQQALASLQNRGSSVRVEVSQQRRIRRRWQQVEIEQQEQPVGALVDVLCGSLPPGGYVTQVAAAPWLDEHGLDVAYDQRRHFVRGRMQAEDFLP